MSLQPMPLKGFRLCVVLLDYVLAVDNKVLN